MVIDCKFGNCGSKMEDSVPSGSVCCFCLTTYEDEVLYGKFYKIEEITTHYFCLLLSSKIQQRGSDAQGILGFLPKDIRNEVRRGKNVSCTYCGKRGATLSCHYSKCKIHFHLPCGRTRDTFHEFFGEFKSFCCKHRKSQRIKQEVLKAMSGKRSTCSICLESVPATPSPNTLWAPCCSKDAWFHRICIQRLALSAGYFFKCPLCNNTAEFLESMRTYGIWIPEQDAAWERDPERYEGLLQRHNSCDAKSCRCRNGRTHHVADTKWEIKLCADCGSQGMHVQCGNLRHSEDWVCSVCSNVSTPTDMHHQKSRKISHSREALMARNRERRSLPVRPTQRVTRQRRAPEEEDEEEGSRPPHSVHSKSEIPALKTDKGASSTPQKDVSCLPLLVQESAAQSRETRPESQPMPQDENSDVEILENSDDEIQHGRVTKNEPLLCNCKWSNQSRNIYHSGGADICCYCCDWAQQYIHIGKSSSASTIKNPQNLLSRFLSTLTAKPGPSLGKGESLCQLWVIHYHSRKDNRASTSQARSNSGSKTPTMTEKPRTRSQSRSSDCQKLTSSYLKSPQISPQGGPSTREVASNRRSSESESRLDFSGLRTRRCTYQNQKISQGKRKRSVSPGSSNIKRKSVRKWGGNSFHANHSSQVRSSENSHKRSSQSTNTVSDNVSELVTQNAKDKRISFNANDSKAGNICAMAKLASFQPVVVLTRYNIRRRERSVSVERDPHRRSYQRGGRSRRDQFTLQKQLKAADNVPKVRKETSLPRPSRSNSASEKGKRGACRNIKNFRERSPIRTRSRSCSVGEDLKEQRFSKNLDNVNSSKSKTNCVTDKENLQKDISKVAVFSKERRSSFILSSSDETDDEIEVGEDALNETIASISEFGIFENSRSSDETDDEIEDEVEIGEENLNDTLASISELGTITYDEDCSSLLSSSQSNVLCNESLGGKRVSSTNEENCSIVSPSTSASSSSSCSDYSPTLTSQLHPKPFSLSPISSPQPLQNPFYNPLPTSSRVLSHSIPVSSSLSTVLTSSATIGEQVGSKNLLSCYSEHNSPISSPLVQSPLPSPTVHAESNNSHSPVTDVPLRRRSQRSCSRNSRLPNTSRASRKIHSDVPIRGSSPPPIFPNRTGGLTELECRIKARALTARKFVPMSPAATQQRAMMRFLQGRR